MACNNPRCQCGGIVMPLDIEAQKDSIAHLESIIRDIKQNKVVTLVVQAATFLEDEEEKNVIEEIAQRVGHAKKYHALGSNVGFYGEKAFVKQMVENTELAIAHIERRKHVSSKTSCH